MPNLNRVMLMGNLTRDPELRYLPTNNTPVVNVGIAINRTWRNQQGEQQEETSFIDCECFGRRAEVINQYLRKGKPVYVEGRLKLDQWQDRDGNNRSKLKVVIENFEFIDGGGGGGGEGGEGGGRGGEARSAPQGGGGGRRDEGGGGGGGGGEHVPVEDEEIPF